MKKIFLGLFILSTFIFQAQSTFAHPLDITHSDIYVEDNNQVITGQSFVHPFLIGLLLETKNIKIQSSNDFYNYADIIGNYLNEKVKISNNDFSCIMTDLNIPPLDEFEIMGSGLEIDWSVKCHKEIEKLEITNTLFIEYSNLQTNKINIFHNNEKQEIQQGNKNISEIILTYKVFSARFDFQNKENNKIDFNDKDNDGLSDEEEILYATNPELADTDNDGYNDKEEIENGWDPLFSEISPGQIKLEEKEENEHNHEEINITSELKKHDEESGHNHLQSGLFQSFLEKLKGLFENDNLISNIYIFILIFILGTLHAVQPGHGKSILISYLIEHNKKTKDAVVFISTMTLTHLGDLVILAIIFKFLSGTSNFYSFVNYLKEASAYILLIIAIYYLINVFIKNQNKTPHCCSKHKASPKASLLGFIAGIAPCAIGWSIMIILFSLNKEAWILPSVIVFGLGIWSSLFLLSIIILKSKKLLTNKFQKFTKYSSALSAILLLAVAIYLIFQ